MANDTVNGEAYPLSFGSSDPMLSPSPVLFPVADEVSPTPNASLLEENNYVPLTQYSSNGYDTLSTYADVDHIPERAMDMDMNMNMDVDMPFLDSTDNSGPAEMPFPGTSSGLLNVFDCEFDPMSGESTMTSIPTGAAMSGAVQPLHIITSEPFTAMINCPFDNPISFRAVDYGGPQTSNGALMETAAACPPRTIGEAHQHQLASTNRKQPRFTPMQKSVLNTWLEANSLDPYATSGDVEVLQLKTGLKPKQIKDYLAKHRRPKKLATTPSYRAVPSDNASSYASNLPVANSTIKSRSVNGRSVDGSSVHSTDSAPSTSFDPVKSLESHPSKISWWLKSLSRPFDEIPEHVIDDQPQPESAGKHKRPLHLSIVKGQDNGNRSRAPSIVIDRSPIEAEPTTQQEKQWDWREPQSPGALLASPTARLSLANLRHRSDSSGRKASESDGGSEVLLDARSELSVITSNNSVSSYVTCRSTQSCTSFDTYGSRKGRRCSSQASFARSSCHPGADTSPQQSGTPEGEFQRCQHCKKSFRDKWQLKRHMVVHQIPEQVYVCTPKPGNPGNAHECHFCSFAQISSPSPCQHRMEECYAQAEQDRFFVRKDQFKQHLQVKHKISQEVFKKIKLDDWQCKPSPELLQILKEAAFEYALQALGTMPTQPGDVSGERRESGQWLKPETE